MDSEFIQEINEAVEDGRIELNKWEENFIQSMNENIEYGRRFTVKQLEAIDRIYEKYLVTF